MCLVHELEELVDNRLEEFPVRLEEARILSDNVHNVRRNDRLVIFSALDLAKSQEIFDNCDQEPLLGFLVYLCG